MASTYIDLHCHVVFSTKNRRNFIQDDWRPELHAYLGGAINGLGAMPSAIGGTSDHVHLLVGLRSTHADADIVREIKKSSSDWAKDAQRSREFAWQEGYAAFSVSYEHRPAVVAYIAGQEEHHRKVSAIDELRFLLDAAGVEYDPSYLE